MRRIMKLAASAFTMLALGLAVPAAAQFSDAYNFIKAVKDKDAAKVKEITDKPGNTIINSRDRDTGEAALHIVTKRGDAAWLGFLLQLGANANVQDGEGNTPLMMAVQSRWADGVTIFTAIKAQVNLQNKLGETALLKAVQNRDAFIAKTLLDAGANPDLNDNSGTSARTMAESDPRAVGIARLLKDVPVRKARPAQGPSL